MLSEAIHALLALGVAAVPVVLALQKPVINLLLRAIRSVRYCLINLLSNDCNERRGDT